jgi:hypothetical protein
VAHGWVVGWYRTGWEIVDISLGGAPPEDGNLVDYQVYTLCRVDRSIRIAAFMDMDIPMTYASLN